MKIMEPREHHAQVRACQRFVERAEFVEEEAIDPPARYSSIIEMTPATSSRSTPRYRTMFVERLEAADLAEQRLRREPRRVRRLAWRIVDRGHQLARDGVEAKEDAAVGARSQQLAALP